MNRRDFIKALGIAGGGALLGGVAHADQDAGQKEFVGVLVDTTRCVGCRTCEEACAEAHGLPVPDIDDESVFNERRKTDVTRWSVVNRYSAKSGGVFAKKQCMHCNQPACAAACLVKAMKKTKEGPVIWRDSKCMGCRFCMISCPFDIPKFEYDSPNPKIRKCILCWERLKKGEQPACVENCPEETLLFGKRRELIEIARGRIYQKPDSYINHIYGEHEVGGTGWLYLSSVPFEQLGFRTDLGNTAYPELTKGFLYSVPLVFTLLPAFLLSVSAATRKNGHEGKDEE